MFFRQFIPVVAARLRQNGKNFDLEKLPGSAEGRMFSARLKEGFLEGLKASSQRGKGRS